MKDDYTIIILTTSHVHFSSKGHNWENVLFELGSEKVNHCTSVCMLEYLYGNVKG